MPFVAHNPHQYVGKPFIGVGPHEENKGQCAALAQAKAPGIPTTPHWRRGKRVGECKPGELTPGTVIATFNKNHDYVSTHAAANSHQFHTALYVGHTVDKQTSKPLTMTIVEQFKDDANTCKGKVRQQTILFSPSPHVSRDGGNYYVVELKPHSTKKPVASRYEVEQSVRTIKAP